jgi:hypothetical protein
MSIKTALGAFGVSMLAASAAMAGGLGNSDNALNDYVSTIQGADQMSAKQMDATTGAIAYIGPGPAPDYTQKVHAPSAPDWMECDPYCTIAPLAAEL